MLSSEVKQKTTTSPVSLLKKINIRAYSMVIALILIWIVFSVLTDGKFLLTRNISNLVRQMAVVSILAIGMVLVIVSGNIDLSVGSLLGMLGGFAAITQVYWGWSTPLTILATVLLGVVVGCYQGYVISFLKVPAFIVTLGGYMAFRGILLGITGGRTISPMNKSFVFLGQAYFGKTAGIMLTIAAILIFSIMAINRRRTRIKYQFGVETIYSLIAKIALFSLAVIVFTVVMNSYKGIPVPVLIMLALLLLLTFIATKTGFGRSIYAIGGNIEAAKYSGLNIRKTLLFVFVVSGVLSSIAGLILTARLNAGTVAAGTMAELDAIAAAVIGGASLAGGIGTVPGAMLGALIMASLDNGMSMMNTEAFWQYIVKGGILVIAVWVDVYTNKRGE